MTKADPPITYGAEALRAMLELSEAEFATARCLGRIPLPTVGPNGEARWSAADVAKAWKRESVRRGERAKGMTPTEGIESLTRTVAAFQRLQNGEDQASGRSES